MPVCRALKSLGWRRARHGCASATGHFKQQSKNQSASEMQQGRLYMCTVHKVQNSGSESTCAKRGVYRESTDPWRILRLRWCWSVSILKPRRPIFTHAIIHTYICLLESAFKQIFCSLSGPETWFCFSNQVFTITYKMFWIKYFKWFFHCSIV